MKLGEVLGLEWLAARLPSKLSGRPRLTVSQSAGLTTISGPDFTIATTSVERVPLYKRGLVARQQKLLRNYQIGPAQLPTSGETVINFGANIGEITMIMAGRGARVIAIEPDQFTLRCLRANTALFPEVDVVPLGLWKEDGELTFYIKSDSADTSAVNKVGEPVTLRVKRLDTVAEGVTGPIKLLIGDAEGAEPEVLSGGIETLRRTEYVAIDAGYERSGSSTFDACSEILRPLGFDILNIDKYGRLLARNGAIARG